MSAEKISRFQLVERIKLAAARWRPSLGFFINSAKSPFRFIFRLLVLSFSRTKAEQYLTPPDFSLPLLKNVQKMLFYPVLLPWPILLHAMGLIALGCTMLLAKPTETAPEDISMTGITTIALGISCKQCLSLLRQIISSQRPTCQIVINIEHTSFRYLNVVHANGREPIPSRERSR